MTDDRASLFQAIDRASLGDFVTPPLWADLVTDLEAHSRDLASGRFDRRGKMVAREANSPGTAVTVRGATQEVQAPMPDKRTDDPMDDSWAVDPRACGFVGCPNDAVALFRKIAEPTTTMWACREHRSLVLSMAPDQIEPEWEKVT